MPVEQKLRLSLHGRTVDIASPGGAFFAYLKKHFFYHLAGPSEAQPPADIELRLSWNKGALKKELRIDENGLRRIATNTYVRDRECVYMDKINGRRTHVRFSIEGRRLSVAAVQEEKRYPRLFKKDDEEVMRRACYHFVNGPLFFYLQHFCNTHPLHAGALSVSGKTFVLVGLDKMGKTTLALESLRLPASSFISDNIIFHDEKGIFPCYTPLKVRAGDRHLLPDSFREITRWKDQVFFAPPASGERSYKPDYVIILCFSDAPFIKELPCAPARSMVLDTNMLASEMKEYFSAATLWNLVAGGEPLLVGQDRALAKLLEQTKCYHFGIGRDEPPSETIKRLVSSVKKEETACR